MLLPQSEKNFAMIFAFIDVKSFATHSQNKQAQRKTMQRERACAKLHSSTNFV